MTLPALTLNDTPRPWEVWDMLWEVTAYLNGDVRIATEVDFGAARDFSSSSKNIKPHKVRWAQIGGHDHGQGGSDYR